MFRISLFILFFFIAVYSSAQKDSIGIIGVSIGTFEFKSNNLNANLRANGATGELGSSYTAIGIDNVFPLILGRRYGEMMTPATFSFGIIVPQTSGTSSSNFSQYRLHG